MMSAVVKFQVRIEQYTQEDKGFWDLMGPYFASAQVKRELGIAMNSDESYRWFLAFVSGDLAGFCAMTPEKVGTRLRHVYVLPEHRSNGVGKQLVAATVTASKKPIVTTVKADDAAFYAKFEFKPTGKARGQYIDLAKG